MRDIPLVFVSQRWSEARCHRADAEDTDLIRVYEGTETNSAAQDSFAVVLK